MVDQWGSTVRYQGRRDCSWLERLSLQVMAALCDILSCTPADLVATTAENAGIRKTATGDLPAPSANVAKLRPRAARILPDA